MEEVAGSNPVHRSKLMLKIFLILLLIFNFYFFIDLILPPKIKIFYPQDNQIVRNDSIVFKGCADKRGDLFINEVQVYLDKNGCFQKIFYLKKGLNKFIIKERKFWGQQTIIERNIIYQ